MEIERKWMVTGWPEGLPLEEEFTMRQGYISVQPTVRIREEALTGGSTDYILCFKSAGGLAREEIERSIDKELFEELEHKIIGKPLIPKTRRTYRLPDGKVDLWFGMSMSFDFYMPADGKINGEDMIFQFLGDDDVFVYIDGVLVLDIGGTHGANSGSINFATGDVTHPREGVSGAAEADDYVTTTLAKKFQTAGMTGSFDGSTFGDYTKHTLQFFYLERGGNVSYCYLRFNTPTLPNNSLTVAKELSGGEQELNHYLAGAMDYRFRVLRPDGSLYVPEGTAYQLLENSTAVGSGTVGAGGYFTLKAGQMAQFTDMLTLGGGSYDYLVEETMPDRLTGQYRQVQYTVGSGTGTTLSPTAEEDFTGFRTDTLTAASTQLVTYRNVVDTSALGELRVTKQVAEGSDAAAGRAFDIGVALGGEAVPAGTPYTVNGEERTVETAGIVPLTHGETAVFTGLLAGTAYAVTETPPEGWRAAFDAAVTADGVTSPTSADGEVPVGGSVAVTVTNATYDYAIPLPLTKTLLGAAAGQRQTFRFLLEETDAEGNVLRQVHETGITVTGEEAADGRLVIGLAAGDTAPRYYRIREAEADGFWCGGEMYRVAVLPNGVDGAVRITVNGSVWDDGALAFVNRTSRSLTVRKTVEGEMGDRSKAFPFTAVLTVDGQAVPFPAGEGYTVSGGQAVFALRHGESLTFTGLPYGGVVTVTEDEICAAILALIEQHKLIAEGAGAVSVAAAMFNKVPVKGRKTVCVVSGGNIDVTILSRVINRGLSKSGRIYTFCVELDDKPERIS